MGRPIATFNGFCGQNRIIKVIQNLCTGATRLAEALSHMCLAGQSGIGKTRLAQAIAHEMGTACHPHYCTQKTKDWEIAKLLGGIQQKADIVFLDEAHALPPNVQEVLYPAIDNLRVPLVDPERNCIVKGEWIEIPAFTLIVASDQAGSLNNALRQRLPERFVMGDYSVPELRQIVFNYASELGILLSGQAATRVAEASRGIPRNARHLLSHIRFCAVNLNEEISKTEVGRIFNNKGIDHDNLTHEDRLYLRCLHERKGYVSLMNMAFLTGIDEASLRRNNEAFLIKQGLVGIDSRGRFLTMKGNEFIKERKII